MKNKPFHPPPRLPCPHFSIVLTSFRVSLRKEIVIAEEERICTVGWCTAFCAAGSKFHVKGFSSLPNLKRKKLQVNTQVCFLLWYNRGQGTGIILVLGPIGEMRKEFNPPKEFFRAPT